MNYLILLVVLFILFLVIQIVNIWIKFFIHQNKLKRNLKKFNEAQSNGDPILHSFYKRKKGDIRIIFENGK